METITTLDHNGQIPIRLEEDGSSLRLTLDVRKLQSPFSHLTDSAQHFQEGLKLVSEGAAVAVDYDRTQHQLTFEAPVKSRQLTIQLYGEPIVTLQRGVDGKWIENPASAHEKLTGTELRLLATSEVKPPNVPASRSLFAGFDPKIHAPITDLHTHSSAQISADKLMDLALKKRPPAYPDGLDYPVELLKQLGIKLNKRERDAVKENGGKGLRFSPLAAEGLKCEIQNEPCDVVPLTALTPEHLERLKYQFNIPQDATMIFSEFDEQYYRFINPLVKNPIMTHDMLMEIGRAYAEQGVKYAELSTASMINLDPQGKASWFEEMVKATEEVEKEYGVQLRYLIGIPRTFKPYDIFAELEKVKYAARHPLIAGVDMLGYESGHTREFLPLLKHIAQWVGQPNEDLETGAENLETREGWDFKRDFTIRVHAGETDKNEGNVEEAIKVARDYGVRMRVAHALNAAPSKNLDEMIAELSAGDSPQLSMELCPDSNVAYNNARSLKKVPFARWLEICKSWFLGTDGGGAIQTTPTQLALSALSAGVTLDQLAEMRGNENKFIEERQEASAKKTASFENHYGEDAQGKFLDGLAAHIKAVTQRAKDLDPYEPKLPNEFQNKTAIFIGGASLDSGSWSDLDEGTRKKMRNTMRMLLSTVDPQKAYFVVGRAKSEGLTGEFDALLRESNRGKPEKDKFQLLGLNTANATEIAESVTALLPQPGDKTKVAHNIVRFMRNAEKHSGKKGLCVFMGGKTFTSDMIKGCAESDGNLDYMLMDSATGASQDWAESSKTERCFDDWHQFIPRLADMLGAESIFRDGVDPKDPEGLQELYRRDAATRARQMGGWSSGKA